MRNLYGIFAVTPTGRPVWAMSYNRRRADRLARLHTGYVTVMRDDPFVTTWDAPTFRVLSDVVVDYRRAGQPAVPAV
jgi:hypothetical protein